MSEFKIHNVEPGTWRTVVIDCHTPAVDVLTAPDAACMYEQIAALHINTLGDEGPLATDGRWLRVVQTVRLWGSAHVETGTGVDYVVTRQRP